MTRTASKTLSAALATTAAASAAAQPIAVVQTRAPRVSTATTRAKTIATPAAKGQQETAYQTLKKVWSARGEILTEVKKGILMEVKKADIVRVLKALPRDAKSPFKLVEDPTTKVHILA